MGGKLPTPWTFLAVTGIGAAGRRSRLLPPGALLVLLLGTAFSITACVTYVPVALDDVPTGEEVRVRFTDQGAVSAARHLGRIRTEVDAGVAPSSPDSMAVTVWLGKNYPGTQFENVRETMILPRYEVRDLHLRRLSIPRTVGALVGAAAVFAVLTDQIFFQEDPNGPPGGDDENPPPAGLTLFSIVFGRTP